MALTATVEKFGMTFPNAYHKITKLTYESSDVKKYEYGTPSEEGAEIPVTQSWVKKIVCHFEMATYASSTARENSAEPIYTTRFDFEPIIDAESSDIIVQAYEQIKLKDGYEDAVDC